MRGVILLTVGAILIWLGLATAGSSGKANAGSGPAADGLGNPEAVLLEDVPNREASMEGSWQDPEGVLGMGYNADNAYGEHEPASSDPDSDAVSTLAFETQGAHSVPLAEAPLQGELDAQTELSAELQREALAHDPALDIVSDSSFDSGLDSDLDSGDGLVLARPGELPRAQDVESDPVFELASPHGNPHELALELLNAWLDQDPTPLQSYLNEGLGMDLGENSRTLVGGFWQGLVGRRDVAQQALRELEENRDGVTAAQLEFLRHAATNEGATVPVGSGRRDALARSMRMILLDDSANLALQEGQHARAARALSDLLHAEVAAPWAPHREALARWAESLRKAQSMHRLHPKGDWPAVEAEVKSGDNPVLVRKRVLRAHPGLRLCTGLMKRVNGVGKYIHPGDILRLPTDPPNMLVDLDARIAIYRHGSEAVLAWQVGIGREQTPTPVGTFTVGEKLEDPPWFRPSGDPVPFGHPENLLGTRWIAWYRDGQRTGYGFHGTWKPEGVGGQVSAGCIRMLNDDVEELFELLPQGSRLIVQP